MTATPHPSPDRVELVAKVGDALQAAWDEIFSLPPICLSFQERCQLANAVLAAIEAGDHIPPVDGGVGG